MITRTIIAAALLIGVIFFTGCQRSQPPQFSTDTSKDVVTAADTAARSKAMAAKDALFARLSGRLMDVMQAEGPAAAIEVCRREADQIARSVSEEHGLTIGRTSTKLRHPGNSPPAWVTPLIAASQSEPQFVELPNGHTGALLPIMLQAKCITCHGSADKIADDVKTQLAKLYPDDQAFGFKEGDLRGWFWIDVPADGQPNKPVARASEGGLAPETHDAHDHDAHDHDAKGHDEGKGHGRGMMGRGPGSGMRVDMTTLHAMFASRDKIKRTVKSLPDGAVAITESDDEKIAALIQEHVSAMESRVHENKPLPPMTFHPIFVNLIKHADDYSLNYDETDKGMKVTYKAEDAFVIMLVQEHAKLISRFIRNGMEEIHKPYYLPTSPAPSPADVSDKK